MSKPTKIYKKSGGSSGFGSDGGDGRGEETGDGGKRGVGLVGKMVYTFKKRKPFSV